MRARRWFVRGAGALLLLAALACGGEEPPPEATGGSWTQSQRQQDAERLPELNEAPEIESLRIEPGEPAGGERVRAVVRTSDPEGDDVEVGFVWSVDGRKLSEGGAEFELPELVRGQRIRVLATASDGLDESEPREATAVVRNRRPVLTKLELEPGVNVPLGRAVVARTSAEDPDEDSVEFRYEWTVNGRNVPEDTARLETSSLRRGDAIQVRVWADDGRDESDAIYSQVVKIGNARPEIVSVPTGLGPDGVFRYTIDVRDPDGDRSFRYYLAKGPDGMSVDPITGEVVWRPTHAHQGVHPVELEVRDPKGASVTQSFELSVSGSAAEPVPAAVQ